MRPHRSPQHATLDPSRAARLDELLALRLHAGTEFFDTHSEQLARLCHAIAERFARGGRLVALGVTPQARSDVRHVAVEFVHPVIVGKRALPAIGLTREGGDLSRQVDLVAEAGDIAIAHDAEPETVAALGLARARDCLTLAFDRAAGAEHELVPGSGDPFADQEIAETAYHVLWELCHVFLDNRGLLGGREQRRTHDSGASSFLYPFLSESQDDLDPVLDDVRRSVLLKASEIGELRERVLTEGRPTLEAAAAALRASFAGGGTLLALGNGGSATDAIDVVADFRAAPQGWPARRAIDLTEDAAIITALANDIGPAAIFARQVIAYGRSGDALLALSTSGGSENVIEALAEARRRGLLTIAMVGYDGGQIASDGLADHVLVVRSENIPRIQEAQASAYHALRELVELAG